MHTPEREKYINHLQDSEKAMLNALADVTDKQFTAKPKVNQWSIAEVIEHVIKVESGVFDYLKKLGAGAPSLLENPQTNEEVFEKSKSRAFKATSPKPFIPASLFKTKEQAITTFQQHRTKAIDFVKNTTIDFKTISFPHQRLGMLNGENWLIFVAGHCIRHAEQIELLKENQ